MQDQGFLSRLFGRNKIIFYFKRKFISFVIYKLFVNATHETIPENDGVGCISTDPQMVSPPPKNIRITVAPPPSDFRGWDVLFFVTFTLAAGNWRGYDE
jgi:hypothetical protein